MCDKTKSPWASESISDTSDPKNLFSNDAPGLSNHPGRPPKEPNKIAARKDNRDRLLNQPSNALSTGVNSANDTDDGVVTSRPSSAESNASEYYIETGRDCLLRSDSDLIGPDEDQSEKTSAGGYHEEQPACKIRIDSAQVPEQSEDEQDLKEEDEKEQVAALKQRNLYMAIQGLRKKRVIATQARRTIQKRSRHQRYKTLKRSLMSFITVGDSFRKVGATTIAIEATRQARLLLGS